ncbi:MAG: PDZ domain-containing protein [Acidobacteria bacterium]|nr:PDZ domain-containing protein [Acidobacteriota bacterium]MBV9477310.1 PDZ domain-containing protein [Acidobacteriota bacterium]
MVRCIPRLILLALVAATVVVRGQEAKCSSTAQECDQQIRKMLSGRRYLGATIAETNPGLLIKALVPDGPAARSGLRTGDRLIAVNGKSLTQASASEFKQILADAGQTGRLWIIVWRRGAYIKVDARLEPYTKEQIDKIVAAHIAQSHTMTAAQ